MQKATFYISVSMVVYSVVHMFYVFVGVFVSVVTLEFWGLLQRLQNPSVQYMSGIRILLSRLCGGISFITFSFPRLGSLGGIWLSLIHLRPIEGV